MPQVDANPEITFVWPFMHWLLLLIPLMAFFYMRLQQQRAAIRSQFSGLGQPSGHSTPGWRRHVPVSFFLLGQAVLIFALARPQMEVKMPRIEGTVMLVFDVSGSMAAEDLKPTRMEAAKAAAQSFIEKQPSTVSIGVVAFSESGFTILPPTNNQEETMQAISRLEPQNGTSLGNGIIASLNTIIGDSVPGDPDDLASLIETAIQLGKTYPYASLVMLTDGENNSRPDPITAALTAADLGVRIYTVGVGSPAGTVLNLDGFSVFTRQDEPLLRQIAETSGGQYFSADSEQQLTEIYQKISPALKIKTEQIEVTALFASAGALLLLAGGLYSLMWFGRLP